MPLRGIHGSTSARRCPEALLRDGTVAIKKRMTGAVIACVCALLDSSSKSIWMNSSCCSYMARIDDVERKGSMLLQLFLCDASEAG